MSEFKSLKFRIANPDQSVRLQEVLFKLGYKWYNSGHVPRNTFAPCIFAESNGEIAYNNDVGGFAEYSDIEHNTEKFIACHNGKPALVKHKWHDVIVAAAEGRVVQRQNGNGTWIDYQGPIALARLCWNEGEEYRIKPEMVEAWAWTYQKPNGSIYTTEFVYETEDDAREHLGTIDWIVKLEPTKKLVEK